MDNEINKFLKNLTDFSFTPNYIPDKQKLKESIYSLLTPEWFRFGPVEDSTKQFLQKEIESYVEKNEPIKILNAIGGFKNYRIDTAPHIDWAEVFHLSFISKALIKICEIYEPGVVLEYSGDAHMACIVDNIKKEWVDTYLEEFDRLVDYFGSITPKNLWLSHKHFLDFYDYEQMKKEINERGDMQDLLEPKNAETIEKNYQRAIQNFCFNGEEDLTQLADNKKEELIKRSILKAYIWYELDFEKRENYFQSFIPICNLKDFPETYCVRSIRHLPCPPFWQGKGVLEIVDNEIHSVILHNNRFVLDKNELTSVQVNNPTIPIPSLSVIQCTRLDN